MTWEKILFGLGIAWQGAKELGYDKPIKAYIKKKIDGCIEAIGINLKNWSTDRTVRKPSVKKRGQRGKNRNIGEGKRILEGGDDGIQKEN